MSIEHYWYEFIACFEQYKDLGDPQNCCKVLLSYEGFTMVFEHTLMKSIISGTQQLSVLSEQLQVNPPYTKNL